MDLIPHTIIMIINSEEFYWYLPGDFDQKGYSDGDGVRGDGGDDDVCFSHVASLLLLYRLTNYHSITGSFGVKNYIKK